ncbi:sufB/sufD domain-containing protein, partial [Cardiosporidium cionae]
GVFFETQVSPFWKSSCSRLNSLLKVPACSELPHSLQTNLGSVVLAATLQYGNGILDTSAQNHAVFKPKRKPFLFQRVLNIHHSQPFVTQLSRVSTLPHKLLFPSSCSSMIARTRKQPKVHFPIVHSPESFSKGMNILSVGAPLHHFETCAHGSTAVHEHVSTDDKLSSSMQAEDSIRMFHARQQQLTDGLFEEIIEKEENRVQPNAAQNTNFLPSDTLKSASMTSFNFSADISTSDSRLHDSNFYLISNEFENSIDGTTKKKDVDETKKTPPSFRGDISIESKIVPRNFDAPRPLKDSSAITLLSNSGWSKRQIDTWGADRNKIYSFLTPTEGKRRSYWDFLLHLVQEDEAFQQSFPSAVKSNGGKVDDEQFDTIDSSSKKTSADALEKHSDVLDKKILSDLSVESSSPVSPLFLPQNRQLFNEWKTLNKVGADICREIPTPQRKLEAWRQQTNLIQFYKSHFDSSISSAPISSSFLDEYIMDGDPIVLVLRDGIVELNLSRNLHRLDTRNIFIGSAFDVSDPEDRYFLQQQLYWIPEYSNFHKVNTQPFHRAQIGQTSRKYDNDVPVYDYRKFDFGMAKFTSLNQAGLKDAAVVVIGEDTKVESPIQIIELSTSAQGSQVGWADKESTAGNEMPLTNPRVLLWLKKGSSASIHQSFVSHNNKQSGMVNSVTRIYMESKATLNHSYSEELAYRMWHWENIGVQNGEDGTYTLRSAQFGASSSRINLQIEGAKRSRQFCYSLGLPNKEQSTSMYQMFHHEFPEMQTDQKYKFLIADKGLGVWRGRVRIERQGIGAMADTLCRVILLNQGAKCVTIPTLEIIPKEVDHATHGAAISDIEKEPIFYLRTRGIDEQMARFVLMKAYTGEILDGIYDGNLKRRVLERLRSMVPLCSGI